MRTPDDISMSDHHSITSSAVSKGVPSVNAFTDENVFEEECMDSDIMSDDGHDGEMTIMNDDDDYLSDDDEEEVLANSIDFRVDRAKITRTGLLPCCVFVGRVRWGTTEWEIYFGQKQILRLHVYLFLFHLWHRHKILRDVPLPWTIWREKRAEKRAADLTVIQDYIRRLLVDRDLRNSEPLLAFLEVSPSRAMSRYGPSLKEGYVHMRMNGAFQLPLYSCFNRTIEVLYRHLYRMWMRIAFISAVIGLLFPLCLIVLTNLPSFFTPQTQLISTDGETVETKLNVTGVFVGIGSVLGIAYLMAFIYKYFQHRLGVIRRWVVLKPSCFAAFRNRSDREPSEVFLFDKTFTSVKGSYKQGVSWMPSGLIVGSEAGFIEIDTGHYYTRMTTFAALVVVCYLIMQGAGYAYDFHDVTFDSAKGYNISSVAAFSNYSTAEVEGLYCGYYFSVPDSKSIHVTSTDSSVVVSQLYRPTNDSLAASTNYFWGNDDISYTMGIITDNIGSGSIVGVSKKIRVATDLFYDSPSEHDIEKVGNLSFHGVQGKTLLQFVEISSLCAIPVKIAVVNWVTIINYLFILFLGGIIAPIAGFSANYIIRFIGIWHAHVRRDHWFRCVQRLQKLKRQQTEYRYNSFAPERISGNVRKDPKNPKGFDENTSGLLLTPREATEGIDPMPTKLDSDGSTDSSEGMNVPPSPPSAVSWHVDGEDTYEAMYKAISNAKYEILIAGWWVCPDLYLLRPGRKLQREAEDEKKPNETQLRNLLLTKAEAGVKIYVLIYREVKLALTLNSAYTKRSLMLHKNIRVLRDPIFQIQSLGFWSHHEKIVCIDQSLAFVGGLDLCFGRYDNSGHPLSDPGGDNIEKQTWPGKDYSNPIIKDFVKVNLPFEDLIDRNSQPRMPWHDVHCSISGPAVQDVAYHFIQRWNFVCSKNDYQLRTGWCICCRSRRFKYLPKCLIPMDFNGWTLRFPASELPVAPPQHNPEFIREDSMEILPFRMTAAVNGARLTGPELSCYTNYLRGAQPRLPNDRVPSLPLSESEILRAQRGESILRVFHPNAQMCNIQVCRSVSMWSAGVPTEKSIQQAYIDTITKAKHYLYIENQFFISGMASNGIVSNRILQALADRIERAVVEKQVFRVYVVMPLLPAFEGNIRSEELTNLHAVMHWQFATICRGRHSLFAALEKVTSTPENYVSFFGLRKYGILPNGCVSTEQIYIHSKLLIADDERVILGSANINDRSMNGDRDSEIALVIDDMQHDDGYMNGQRSRRGKVAGALRLQLFREHLGLSDEDNSILDPTVESTWSRIRFVSQQNTKIFENVFDCAPSNRMQAFSSFRNIEITQVYENQRLNVLKGAVRHAWDGTNLKEGDYEPWTDVNGVPIPKSKIDLDDFVVDSFKDKRKKQLFSMDNDGWCYARNFSIFQEVRTGKTDFKKREKLQHLVADRLMAQVRRRRWVKKGSAPFAALERISSVSESDEEEHSRFFSLWRRLQNGDFARSNSLTLPSKSHMGNPTAGMGDNSYPNSPSVASFRRPPFSPHRKRALSSLGRPNTKKRRGSLTGNQSVGTLRDRDWDDNNRDSNESSMAKSLSHSLRKWHSFMEAPMDFGRRSVFSSEYFNTNDSAQVYGDEPLLESARGSVKSSAEDDLIETEADDCQISHLKTAATVPKEGESRARGQLSEIRGHLVEFPLYFLADEILKPSILPSDIHI